MTLDEFYEKNGGNLTEVLQRLPSEAIVKKFVCKFAEDPSFQRLKEALRIGDLRAAFLAVHTLKGIAQNLGFSDLAATAHHLTEDLRSMSGMPQQAYVDAVEESYTKLMGMIGELE